MSKLLATVEPVPCLVPYFGEFSYPLFFIIGPIHFHQLFDFRLNIPFVVIFELMIVGVHSLRCSMRIIPYKFFRLIKLFRFGYLFWMRDRLKRQYGLKIMICHGRPLVSMSHLAIKLSILYFYKFITYDSTILLLFSGSAIPIIPNPKNTCVGGSSFQANYFIQYLMQEYQILYFQINYQSNIRKMSKKQMTLVYYYIPEDHDDEETPNVFGVMVSKNNIRLQHIYENFPLKGSYIFRFKVMYDNTIAWLDLPELQTKLPTFKDKIVVKATRVSWEIDHANPYGHYRFSKKNPNPAPTQQQTVKNQPPTPPQKTEKVPPPQPQPTVKTQSADLLSHSHHEPAASTKVGNIPQDFDLLSTPINSKSNSSVDVGLDNLLI